MLTSSKVKSLFCQYADVDETAWHMGESDLEMFCKDIERFAKGGTGLLCGGRVFHHATDGRDWTEIVTKTGRLRVHGHKGNDGSAVQLYAVTKEELADDTE